MQNVLQGYLQHTFVALQNQGCKKLKKLGGIISPSLVAMELTDLPKIGDANDTSGTPNPFVNLSQKVCI